MTRAALLVAVLPLSVSACAGKADAKSPAAAGPGATDVVAEVEGAKITWGEMDERAKNRLVPVRQEEYEARRAAIEEILYDKLVAREAEHRGVTREALFQAEVEAKAERVTPATVNEAYEQNKDRLAGRSKPEVLPEIEKAMRAEARSAREAAFRRELFSRSRISIKLEAPRVEVPIHPSAPAVGPADARITLVEFSDYQCPYCHRAQQTVDEVLKQYGGKVRFVHGEFPIPGHPRAFAAALAARCAGEQARFWDYHRSLMTVRGDFSDSDLEQRAGQIGLDGKRLGECLASGRHDASVNDAREAARNIGVNSTPTFFINGRMIVGALPFEEFRKVLDEELARAGG